MARARARLRGRINREKERERALEFHKTCPARARAASSRRTRASLTRLFLSLPLPPYYSWRQPWKFIFFAFAPCRSFNLCFDAFERISTLYLLAPFLSLSFLFSRRGDVYIHEGISTRDTLMRRRGSRGLRNTCATLSNNALLREMHFFRGRLVVAGGMRRRGY